MIFTVDSIMNFEENALVEFCGRKGIVVTKFRKVMRVRFLDSGLYEHFHYSDLKVLDYNKTFSDLHNSGKPWTKGELEYLTQHVQTPIDQLMKDLQRSYGSISTKKFELKRKQAA